MPRVRITDAETDRLIWSGPYEHFERQWFNRFSVSEFVMLLAGQPVDVGGGELPLWVISLERQAVA